LHRVKGDFSILGALDFGAEARQGLLQCLFRGCVQHLRLDPTCIGRPGVKENLAPGPFSALILEVVDYPPTIILWKSFEKLIVVRGVRSRLDNDLLVVIAQLVDDVFEFLAKLELIVRLDAILVDGYTGGLQWRFGYYA